MVLILKCLFPMLLWAWILSSSYSRYVLPRVESVHDLAESLEKRHADGDLRGPLPGIAAGSLRVVLSLSQIYVLGIWSGYCVLRVIRYTHLPGAEHKWIMHVLAFLICEGALGVIAHRETYRGILSILHSAMAMGMFVMFSLNPYMMAPVYPWLIRTMGIQGLL